MFFCNYNGIIKFLTVCSIRFPIVIPLNNLLSGTEKQHYNVYNVVKEQQNLINNLLNHLFS